MRFGLRPHLILGEILRHNALKTPDSLTVCIDHIVDVSKIKSQHFISYLRNIFADFLSHISLLNVMHFRKRKRTDVIFDFVHNIAVPNFTLISIEQPGFVLPIMIFLQSLLLFLLPGWYSPRPPNPLSLARFRSLAT